MPIHTAAPMMSLLAFTLFIFLTIPDRHDVNWDELRILVPVTLLGKHIGNRISQETFSKLLAVMLLASGVNVLLK